MNLGIFLDMEWSDPVQRAMFLQAHEQEHHLLNEASTDLSLTAVMYPLGDLGDEKVWLKQNAQIHNDLAVNIGLDFPPDLEEWDLSDPEQAHDWFLDHLSDHDRLATAYNVLN